MVAAVLFVAFVDSRTKLTRLVLVALSVWGLLHMAGGLVPVGDHRVLYNVSLAGHLRFDRLVHALGFGSATLACYQVLRPRLAPGPVRAGVVTLVALAGMGIGAMNEVVEFVAGHFLKENNIGGYQDAGGDLIANAIGCSIAAFLAGVFHRPGRADGASSRTEGAAG